MMPVVKGDRYRDGRGHSIYDNVNGEMWIVNDEDPEKIDQGFETCAVLESVLKVMIGLFGTLTKVSNPGRD